MPDPARRRRAGPAPTFVPFNASTGASAALVRCDGAAIVTVAASSSIATALDVVLERWAGLVVGRLDSQSWRLCSLSLPRGIMADSTPAGTLLALMGASPPLVLSSVEGRVCGKQGSPVKTAIRNLAFEHHTG